MRDIYLTSGLLLVVLLTAALLQCSSAQPLNNAYDRVLRQQPSRDLEYQIAKDSDKYSLSDMVNAIMMSMRKPEDSEEEVRRLKGKSFREFRELILRKRQPPPSGFHAVRG